MSCLHEPTLSYNLNQIVVVVKLKARGYTTVEKSIVSASFPISLLYFETLLIVQIKVLLTSKNRMKRPYNYYKAGQTDISLIKVSRGLNRHRHSQF